MRYGRWCKLVGPVPGDQASFSELDRKKQPIRVKIRERFLLSYFAYGNGKRSFFVPVVRNT